MENNNIKNAAIKEAYEKYLASPCAGLRLELEKTIASENEKAGENFVAENPFDGTFTAFLNSEKCFRIASATFDNEGNIAITENIPVRLTAYKYLKLAVNADKLKKIEETHKEKAGTLKAFFENFITRETEEGETVVSIKSAKKALEPAFVAFGFAGHITSSNLKASALHCARVAKDLKTVKVFKLSHLLTIFEMVDHANRVAEGEKAKTITEAMKVLENAGYKVEKQEEEKK